MPIVDVETLPQTIDMGHHTTMTFLRNEPYLSRIHAAAVSPGEGEPLYVPPHWHATHDELFRIVKGRLQVTIAGEARIYVPEDGEILVPRGTVHSLRCFQGEETIFEERTEPMDVEKELFFRNAMSSGPNPRFLHFMVACHRGDTLLVLPGHFQWLERGFGAFFGGYIAPLFGYQLEYEELKVANELLPILGPSTPVTVPVYVHEPAWDTDWGKVQHTRKHNFDYALITL